MSGTRTQRELLDELDRWRVRAARGTGKARVPLRDLEASCGVPRSSLAKYLAGATVMPADVLDAVVQALGADAKQTREWAVAWEEATMDHLRSGRPEVESVRGVWQLPADTGLFTGRSDEVQAIVDLAEQASGSNDPGAVVIAAIDGMGGVGKTALAVHAGHLLADRFPGGALFVELHTHTVGVAARTAFDAQGSALVALGVAPQSIPADPDTRAAAYRHRLAGTRTLIVVDDARDVAQIRTLLPGTAGCLVLVTSRNRLKALDDAEALRLDVLPQDEAIDLFCRTAGLGRAGTDDPAVAQTVRLCAGLPLAVRITGALLRARPAWTPQHLLNDLTENLAGLKGFDDGQRRLPAVLDMSYRYLPEPAAELFRRLGQIPGPDSDTWAAAALIDCDPKTAGRLLAQLADRSMLTEHTAGRWAMHDLLREHTHTLADAEDGPEQRHAALERLLHYYAHTAQSASVFVACRPRPTPDGSAPAHAPGLTDAEAARAWLRTEYPNLDAAWTHAHIGRLDRHTIALAAGVAEILHTDAPWSRALEIHQAADRVARRVRPAARANVLNDLGWVRALAGDYPGAVDALKRALEIYRTFDNHLGAANALNSLALVLHQIGDSPGAADAQEQALEIYRQLGNRLAEGNALSSLGLVRQQIGDLPGAADAEKRALEIFRQLGDRNGEAAALNFYGATVAALGDRLRALTIFHQALAMNRELSKPDDEAISLEGLADHHLATGEPAQGLTYLNQALEIYQRLGMRLDIARLQAKLCEPHVQQ